MYPKSLPGVASVLRVEVLVTPYLEPKPRDFAMTRSQGSRPRGLGLGFFLGISVVFDKKGPNEVFSQRQASLFSVFRLTTARDPTACANIGLQNR